jgi:hypothetical protein
MLVLLDRFLLLSPSWLRIVTHTPSVGHGDACEPAVLRSIFLSQTSCQEALSPGSAVRGSSVTTAAHTIARRQLLRPDPLHTNQ